MKFGTFVLGGLAGAAVVMLMQSRTMTAVTGGMGMMWKQRMNNWKENAIEKGLNVKFGASQGKGSGDHHFSSADSASAGLKQVEELASKDPHVKKEINDILHENSH